MAALPTVRCSSLPLSQRLLPHSVAFPPSARFPSPATSPLHLSLRRFRHIRAQEDESRAPSPGDDLNGKDASEGFIARSESTIAKLFGSGAWFAILGVSLVAFAGGYIYLLVNFGDFSDIPIFGVGTAP